MTQVAVRTRNSTIVRLFSAPPPVRASFGILERVAPALGARWAERIWFTLPRPATTHAAPAGSALAGETFEVEVGAPAHRIVGEVWGPPCPTVYLLHGWAGNRGQFRAFVGPLLAEGLRVVSFDAPSHGGSAPGAYGQRSTTIPEFAQALAAVTARFGPPRGLVAHSLGATAAAVALCDGLKVDRVVLLAPMASPLGYARQFAAVLGFGERTFGRLVTRVERRVGAPMRHFDVPELGRAVAMPPTLIIHDRDDASTPVSDGAAIAAAWSSARLTVTTGLGHRRMLGDPGVVADTVAFLSGD